MPWNCTLAVAVSYLIVLPIKLCLFFYPSVDDVAGLYQYLVAGASDSVAAANLAWGRVSAVPLAWAVQWLGFDHSSVTSVLFFGNELLFAALVGLVLTRAAPDLRVSGLTALILCASLHPGFFELNSFGSARATLFVSLCSLLVLVLLWSSSAVRNAMLCGIASLVIATSYQGGLGLFIVVVGALLGITLLREDRRIRHVGLMAAACVAGVAAAMAVNYAVIGALHSATGMRPHFRMTSLEAMAAKFHAIVSRLSLEFFGVLTTPGTESARICVLAALLALAAASLASNWRHVRLLGARVWVALMLVAGGTLVAGLQPFTLPFDYSWFPPRTYFWFFAGVVFLVGSAAGLARVGLARAPWFAAACWVPAALLLIANAGIAASYSQLRSNDFALAHAIGTKLSDAGFRWNKPVVVAAGSWQRMARFSSGTVGDMVSLLQPRWSGPFFIGLVARKPVLAPSQEQWRSGEEQCDRMRAGLIQYHVSIGPEYALVCF